MHWALPAEPDFSEFTSCADSSEGVNVHPADPPRADPIARIQKVLAGLGGQVWTDEQLRERLAVVAVDLANPTLDCRIGSSRRLQTVSTQFCIAPGVRARRSCRASPYECRRDRTDPRTRAGRLKGAGPVSRVDW